MSTTRMPASAALMVRSSGCSKGKDFLENRLHVLGRFLSSFAVAADRRAFAHAGAREARHRARDVLARRPHRHDEPVDVRVEVAAHAGDDVLGVNRRTQRVEAMIGVRVHDHVHRGALRFEPLRVLLTGPRRGVVVASAEQHQHRRAGDVLRYLPGIAGGIERGVRREPGLIVDDGTTKGLERRVERDLSALGKAHDADPAAVERWVWSVAVSRMFLGVKLSTTKAATPMSFRWSAHQNSRSCDTPALPCAMTMAGTGPVAFLGRTKVPKMTVFGSASRFASAKKPVGVTLSK